jgi:DNA repair protein RecO
MPFAEADRIVVLYSESAGKLTGIARGSLKMTSKITGALEPMTLVQLRYVAPYGKEMVVITGCDAISSIFGKLQSPEQLAVAGVLSELTIIFNSDHDPNQLFFRLLNTCQGALLNGVNPQLVLRYFEIFTLKFSGYLPAPDAIKNPVIRKSITYLLRTHVENVQTQDPGALKSLATYLRRIIKHALDRTPKSYTILNQLQKNGS